MASLECTFVSTQAGIDVLPFLSDFAPPAAGFNETCDNQAQENQSIAVNCGRDPEVNKQNTNFRNLINGNELAIINKLLSVEESVSACAELQILLQKH